MKSAIETLILSRPWPKSTWTTIQQKTRQNTQHDKSVVLQISWDLPNASFSFVTLYSYSFRQKKFCLFLFVQSCRLAHSVFRTNCCYCWHFALNVSKDFFSPGSKRKSASIMLYNGLHTVQCGGHTALECC